MLEFSFYIDHGYLICKFFIIEFGDVITAITVLTIVCFLNLDFACQAKGETSGFPSRKMQ
jgi:hypothetical protein